MRSKLTLLERNFSILFKTARAEIDRKNNFIRELNAELDQSKRNSLAAQHQGSKRPRSHNNEFIENFNQYQNFQNPGMRPFY